MKFLIAKNDGIRCHGCEAEIMRGEEMVLTFMNKPGFKRTFCFHTACYIPWFTGMFNQKWYEWKNGDGSNQRPKRGRPVVNKKPTRGERVNRLKTLLNYHKRLGHDTKVLDIQKSLDKLLQNGVLI